MELPKNGEWPCQTEARVDITDLTDMPERLVAFLYRLLRDGATCPGAVEEHAIAIMAHNQSGGVDYTNPHLEGYARALATHLLR